MIRFGASRSCSALRTHWRSTSTTSGGTFIEDFAFTRSWPVHGIHHVPVTFKTETGRNNDIHGAGKVHERRVEFRRTLVWIGDLGKQHQQVDVAIRTGVAPGARAEEDDLVRREPLCDSPHQIVQNCLAFRNFAHGIHDNAHRSHKRSVASMVGGKWDTFPLSEFHSPSSTHFSNRINHL